METVRGDLLKATEDAIGHGCNCRKTMGSGVAKALRAKWPQVYQADLDFNDVSDANRIGWFSYADADGKRVYNIYTQINYLPRTVDHFEYEGFRIGLGKVFENMKKDGLKSLALPKIGAGLAGGNWENIKNIIEDVSKEHGIIVKIYEI